MADARTETAFGFSLIEGGLLSRLQRAAHLLGSHHDTVRRTLVLAVVGWLPAVVLALIGRVPPGKLLPLHLRFLIAIPILLWAEGLVDRRVRAAVAAFVDTGVVVGDGATRYRAIVGQMQQLRESAGALAAVVAVAFGMSVVSVVMTGAQPFSVGPAAADVWIAFVSLPLFRIVMLLWVWRWLVWAILLARVSRLDLRLVPTHPDQAGGIGFLEPAALSFLIVHVATGVVLSGGLVLSVTSKRAALASLAEPIIGFGALVAIMVVGPLIVFARKLLEARRRGQLEYGALATRHNRAFGERWIDAGGAIAAADPVGDPGISSLADIGMSFSFVDKMRILPFSRRSVMLLIAACLGPLLPSAFAQIPIDEMVKRVVGGVLL